MDFSADGSAAAVLTYGHVLLFPRKDGETWAAALAREPVRLPPHNLTQAEATCFSADGRAVYVASEKTRNLLRYDLR
jgi:sugar lactone lactonase YvrE